MLIAKGSTVFQQRFYRPDGTQVGTRTIAPWVGGSRDAPLRIGKDDVAKIELSGMTYRLEYELFNPGTLGSDIRYFLMEGDTTLATAAAFRAESMRRWEIDIDGERYELAKRAVWPRVVFKFEKGGRHVGTVRETTRLLALTRTYEISSDLPFPPVVLAFLYHLVIVRTHG